ncbi:MAG: TorF family putative porin [Hyphomicrobium sp.]|jgi:uncharacterized protein (TIGR02001 family)
MFKATIKTVAATGAALLALTGAALADGSIKDAPAPAPAREFTYSFTIGATSDYVFRGISFADESPAFQPSINFGYGIAYLGVWGSNLDNGAQYGSWETDFYGGIKPVLGPVTFDFGAVYYAYFGGSDVNYVELKAGASGSPVKNLTVGATAWYTPDQSNYVETYSIEGTAAYTLPALGIFTPTLSGLVGYSTQTDDLVVGVVDFTALGVKDYTYWNAGLALAVEKFTFDFRYWDTTIDNGLADERFVFSASITLP